MRARKAVSNPTSPVSNSPRRALSTPDDLGRQEMSPDEVGDGETERRQLQRLTAPPDMLAPCNNQNMTHDKRVSSVSVYDNINHQGVSSSSKPDDGSSCEQKVRHRPPPHPGSLHRPIAEREIPYNTYHQTTSRSRAYHTQYSDQYDSSGSRDSGQGDSRADYAEIRWQGNCLQTDNSSRGYSTGQTRHAGRVQLDGTQRHPTDTVCYSSNDCTSNGNARLSAGDVQRSISPKLTETFNSSTLKKMLQVLPDTSPGLKETDKPFDYSCHNTNCSQSTPPPAYSECTGPTKASECTGPTRASECTGPTRASECTGPSRVRDCTGPIRDNKCMGPSKANRPVKPERVSSNPTVKLRHSRDSYPGGNNRDASKMAAIDRSVRAATLPPGRLCCLSVMSSRSPPSCPFLSATFTIS